MPQLRVPPHPTAPPALAEKSEVWIVEDGEVHPWDGDFEDYKDELVREIAAELDEQVNRVPGPGLAGFCCSGSHQNELVCQIAAELEEQVSAAGLALLGISLGAVGWCWQRAAQLRCNLAGPWHSYLYRGARRGGGLRAALAVPTSASAALNMPARS